ncbi:MAG: photosystem I reaction center subunit VIII [Limnothrix sp. RL_2_0]|nr:photosystem I reaction center subunit VIII [Limnothrix sp. RL_2_0]
MTGTYAASFLPAILVPGLPLMFFVTLGLLFTYIETEAEA